jgi:hypothetical protein
VPNWFGVSPRKPYLTSGSAENVGGRMGNIVVGRSPPWPRHQIAGCTRRVTIWQRLLPSGLGWAWAVLTAYPPRRFLVLPRISTMDPKSQRSKRQNVTLLLDAAIEAMNLAKEISSMTPAKAVFGSVSIILTMIKVGFLLVRLDEPQANVSRIRWPTKPTTSSSG